MPLSQSHTRYSLISREGVWLIFRDDSFVAGFAALSLAEMLVQHIAEAGCRKGMASQVLVEDEHVCEKRLCCCLAAQPAGTPLN
jgi:hypothetical protein